VIVAIAPDSELKLLSVSTPARGHQYHLMMRVKRVEKISQQQGIFDESCGNQYLLLEYTSRTSVH